MEMGPSAVRLGTPEVKNFSTFQCWVSQEFRKINSPRKSLLGPKYNCPQVLDGHGERTE